jgi:hypothetical protein
VTGERGKIMGWYVIECPEHGRVTTADYADAAGQLAVMHDALRHRGERHATVTEVR